MDSYVDRQTSSGRGHARTRRAGHRLQPRAFDDGRHGPVSQRCVPSALSRGLDRSPSRQSVLKLQKKLYRQLSVLCNSLVLRLTDARLLAVVNLFTFVVLVTLSNQLFVLPGWRFVFGTSLKSNSATRGYPRPVDLAMQARARQYPPADNASNYRHSVGFSGFQAGTFRGKYPAVHLKDVFDDIHVLTNPRCPDQTAAFQSRVAPTELAVTYWETMAMKDVRLDDPPIMLRPQAYHDPLTGAKMVLSILKRQVAYTATHIQIWRQQVRLRKSRSLIIDDSLFPRDRLLKQMPALFNQIDQESLAGQTPWHVVTFRRKVSEASLADQAEDVWCSNPRYNHPVVRAAPSYGAGMYAVSLAGAEWLLKHVHSYRAPLDIELALLQREYPDEFVVLSACNNDQIRDFCPDIVKEIPVTDSKHHFECLWRRLQERHVSEASSLALDAHAFK